MLTITCPSCKTEGKFSVLDADWEGTYKCWKCRELFLIRIENNKLVSCEPQTQEEFEQRQQEVEKQKQLDELRDKFRRG